MGKRKLSTQERKERAERRRERRQAKATPVAGDAANAELMGIMLNEDGLEPITPALLDELVATGAWTREAADGARELAAQGFRYHRGRNSLFGPTEWGR